MPAVGRPEGFAVQELHDSVYVAASAALYGQIRVGERSSIWPQVVVRAEANHVTVGCMTNIQDFVMIHIGFDHATSIGDFCSITHHATVHGCTIEDACLVGINAVVMDGAVVGRGSIVAPGAVITEGKVIPPHSIVAGVPGKVIKQRDSERENRLNAWHYYRNAKAFGRDAHRAWDGAAFEAWKQTIEAKVAADADLAELEALAELA